MTQIFISYAREDREAALRLYRDLQEVNLRPWLDSENLLGGQEWKREIDRAIRSSSHFVALVSRSSVSKKGFVQKEVREALEILEEVPPGQIFLIPVRIDESIPAHPRLADLHWIDLFPSYSEGLRRLVTSLSSTSHPEVKPDKQTQRPLSSPSEKVIQTIRARAEHDFPNDFSTRRFRIEEELIAWRSLQAYTPADIPREVIEAISERAEDDFPDDYSTRLFRIETEVDAYRSLRQLSFPDVPQEVVDVVVSRAERDFPNDYSTRLFRINSEVEAWRDLQG